MGGRQAVGRAAELVASEIDGAQRIGPRALQRGRAERIAAGIDAAAAAADTTVAHATDAGTDTEPDAAIVRGSDAVGCRTDANAACRGLTAGAARTAARSGARAAASAAAGAAATTRGAVIGVVIGCP